MKNGLGTLAAAILTAMTLVPTPATAYCLVEVYATRTYRFTTYTYFYGRPSGISTYKYYGYTTNAYLGRQLLAAENAGIKVGIGGGAATCPLTGDYRYIGVIDIVYTAP